MTYISLSASLQIIDLLKDKTINKEAFKILTLYINEGQNMKNTIINIFNNENVVIPLGFNKSDIVPEVPPLYDDIFKIMFFRKIMKLNFGYDGVFSSMSYMKEVNDIFKLNFKISNKYYMMTTNYLLGKGV